MPQIKITQTAATKVYAGLRDAILSGELAPGQKLAIDAVRKRFGAGATPVREALNRLISGGLVVSRDLRGFFVADLDEPDLIELYCARLRYFTFILRESIKNGDSAWEERVLVAFHRLSKTPWSSSQAEFDLNLEFRERLLEFYIALFSGCGSRWLVDFAVRLHQECSRFFWVVMKSKFETNRPESMHRAIVDAVLARKTDLAVQLLETLNENISQTVLNWRANVMSAKEKRARRPRRPRSSK